MKKYEIGIVFGGGGARGFAHLGVMKVLAEQGITPDIVFGVSAEAIAGVFLAAGQQPDDIMELMGEPNFTVSPLVNLVEKIKETLIWEYGYQQLPEELEKSMVMKR